ncbi:transglycosylase SLT domain-containing protein [Vibrio nomapromontoriensis]|uniref:transglycosylase SLT domain-containing protein n=1 Tax=Vibrio nomapromontoriensis TaxID=2910246 RepID=UPI003D0F6D1F
MVKLTTLHKSTSPEKYLLIVFIGFSGFCLADDVSKSLSSKTLPGIHTNVTKHLALKPQTDSMSSKHHRIYKGSGIEQLRGGSSLLLKTGGTTKSTLPHSKVNAYLPIIHSASKSWGIDASLILAVIHVESYFNPKAKSDAPAFGLMQIMKSGAVAEISERYFANATFTTEQLYMPSVNINIGTAYLSVLQQVYLNDIHSSRSKEWLAIAAYNCGPSNLLKYFKRTNSVEKFSHTVNKMSEEALFDYLTTEFPISETRGYVKKVINHKSTYRHIHQFN